MPRIVHAFGSVRRLARTGNVGRNFRACTKTGIEKPLRFYSIKSCAVGIEPCRLTQHGLFPVQAQPGEIFKNRRFVFRPRATKVDIFDAKQKATALRGTVRRERREGVPQMEIAGWTGGEARDNHCGTERNPNSPEGAAWRAH